MKKKIIICILIFLSIMSATAKGTADILGVGLGASKEDVKAMLLQKDWNIEEKEGSYTIKKKGGTFASLTVSYISYYFINDKLDEVLVAFTPYRPNYENLGRAEDVQKVLRVLVDLFDLTYMDRVRESTAELDILIGIFVTPDEKLLKYAALTSDESVEEFFYFQTPKK